MDQNLYDKIDPLVDDIGEQLSKLFEGDHFDLIRQRLTQLSSEFSEFSVALEMNIQVFDSERGNSLPLLQTGLSTFDGEVPYQVWGDSTPHRYVVHGDIVIVPHDHCPQCWGDWEFKDLHPECPECGVRMGDQVRLLLDSDRCPHCENGTVSASQPKCTECGFAVNPDHVMWG
ncbi:MAG: hypothetical protein ABGZ35_10620 [Planctomycetaceae bacterium]